MNCNLEPSLIEKFVNNIFNFRKVYNVADIGYKMFLSIVNNDDTIKDMYLSELETKVLEIAIARNRGIISYCNNDKKDIIQSLYQKGLIHLSDDGEMFIVAKVFEFISYFNKDSGYVVLNNKDDISNNKNTTNSVDNNNNVNIQQKQEKESFNNCSNNYKSINWFKIY